jgi:hypothetical protein
MPVFMNNCRCRDHVGLFGANAFYDLNTTGLQARMATGLKPGQECVVASYDENGGVVFNWHTLSKESIEPDPDEPRTNVRVFRGKLIKSERLSKGKAAKTKPYSVFFNVRGDFKRPSVVK